MALAFLMHPSPPECAPSPYGQWKLATAPGNHLADTTTARTPIGGHCNHQLLEVASRLPGSTGCRVPQGHGCCCMYGWPCVSHSWLWGQCSGAVCSACASERLKLCAHGCSVWQAADWTGCYPPSGLSPAS